MSENTAPTAAARREELQRSVRNGANWFYWIAGLSLLNSLIALFAGEWNFIFGLGITQVFDAIGQGLAAEATGSGAGYKVVALMLTLGAVATYGLFGWLANRGKKAGFVTGMTFYALDGGIFLVAGDMLGAGFHVFALFLMGRGFKALRDLQELPAETPQAAVEAEPVTEPTDEIVEAVEDEQYERVP